MLNLENLNSEELDELVRECKEKLNKAQEAKLERERNPKPVQECKEIYQLRDWEAKKSTCVKNGYLTTHFRQVINEGVNITNMWRAFPRGPSTTLQPPNPDPRTDPLLLGEAEIVKSQIENINGVLYYVFEMRTYVPGSNGSNVNLH